MEAIKYFERIKKPETNKMGVAGVIFNKEARKVIINKARYL